MSDAQALADIYRRRGSAWVRDALDMLDEFAPTVPANPARVTPLEMTFVTELAADAVRVGTMRLTDHREVASGTYTVSQPEATGKPADYYDVSNPNVKERGPGYVIWNTPPEDEAMPLGERHTGNGPMDQPIPPIAAIEPEINFRDRPGLNDHRVVYEE